MRQSDAQSRLINFELKCTIEGKKKRRLGCRPLPPQNIVRKIKEYDPEIEIWYNRIWGKWMLFRNGYPIMTVKEPDGSYRPLDHRVLTSLRRADAWTRGRAVLDEIEEHNLATEINDDRSFRSYVKDTSEELRKQFRRATADVAGARNLPKEDLVIPDVDELEKRRQKRLASLPANYKRKPMPPVTMSA